MKLYEKIIDGKQHCKPSNKIVIIKDGMQTFNPTEEMLLADGWKVHEPVLYEPTAEEILNREKEYKTEEIIRHDSSIEVNGFYIDGQEMWIDKATRTGLMLRFQSEQLLGDTETTLWYGSKKFVFPLDVAQMMLHKIEKYASQCYDNTQMHLANINILETLEDVQNYDYKSGYPEKLTFNTVISQ